MSGQEDRRSLVEGRLETVRTAIRHTPDLDQVSWSGNTVAFLLDHIDTLTADLAEARRSRDRFAESAEAVSAERAALRAVLTEIYNGAALLPDDMWEQVRALLDNSETPVESGETDATS